MSANTRITNDGFTIVELLVVIVVTGILTISLLASITYYYASVVRNDLLTNMTIDSQNLLRTLSEEIRYGAGVRQSNSITDPNAPSGGWNTSNTSFVIVIAVPAEDTSHNYITDPTTGSPYMNELVYYRNGNTLYRRTLANPNAAGNATVTSCPATSTSSSCPADAKIVDYLKNITFTLYDQDNAITSDPTLARSVKIDATMEHDTFGDPLSISNSVQVTLRNTF